MPVSSRIAHVWWGALCGGPQSPYNRNAEPDGARDAQQQASRMCRHQLVKLPEQQLLPRAGCLHACTAACPAVVLQDKLATPHLASAMWGPYGTRSIDWDMTCEPASSRRPHSLALTATAGWLQGIRHRQTCKILGPQTGLLCAHCWKVWKQVSGHSRPRTSQKFRPRWVAATAVHLLNDVGTLNPNAVCPPAVCVA